jgi:hypothetical protein
MSSCSQLCQVEGNQIHIQKLAFDEKLIDFSILCINMIAP